MTELKECKECDGKGELERTIWKRFDTALEPCFDGLKKRKKCEGTGNEFDDD